MIQEATIITIPVVSNPRVEAPKERVSMVLIIKRKRTHRAGNKILPKDNREILLEITLIITQVHMNFRMDSITAASASIQLP